MCTTLITLLSEPCPLSYGNGESRGSALCGGEGELVQSSAHATVPRCPPMPVRTVRGPRKALCLPDTLQHPWLLTLTLSMEMHLRLSLKIGRNTRLDQFLLVVCSL